MLKEEHRVTSNRQFVDRTGICEADILAILLVSLGKQRKQNHMPETQSGKHVKLQKKKEQSHNRTREMSLLCMQKYLSVYCWMYKLPIEKITGCKAGLLHHGHSKGKVPARE